MLNLISKKRVHSDGRHNAFTDIVFFKDKYYLVFRNGTHHVSADGKIMIMTSEQAHFVTDTGNGYERPKTSCLPGKTLVSISGGLGCGRKSKKVDIFCGVCQ